MGRAILFNGQISDDSIQISSESELLNYGKGFFETLLYENGRLYFYDDHIERIATTLRTFENDIDFSHIGKERILELIKNNGCETKTLRVKIIYAPIAIDKLWDTCVFIREYKRDTNACSVCIHREHKGGFLYNFKSTNYWANTYWRKYYRKHFSADEVLFPGTNNNILEGSYTNCLVIKGTTLFSVDNRETYLSGIMQKNIIEHYRTFGFQKTIAQEGGYSIAFLFDADEILLTNSLIIARSVEKLYAGRKKLRYAPLGKGWAERIRNYFLSPDQSGKIG
jgi:branched-subunit amino acid aminotransferase/4-amino-4-deoxychorismate lyase